MALNDTRKHRWFLVQNSYLSKKKRGFTLTEIAIVFIIGGIVIGGIFAAASTVQYRVRLNQAIDEINQIVANTRALYAGQNELAAATAQYSQGYNLSTQLSAQGVFPKEMLRPSNNVAADHPWDSTTGGASSQVGSAQVSLVQPPSTPGASPLEFTVRFVLIPPDVCADLLVRNSQPGTDTGLVKIVVTGATTTGFSASLNQLPINPLQAAAVCVVGVAGTTYTIDWYYNLGS